MIPVNLWEHQNAIKTLYSRCIEKICGEHRITRMELDILLFLANNPCFDTATDIVEIRYLSKSQVSASIRLLEEKGYIRKMYAQDNRKTAHLKICERAAPIIADGQAAQKKFAAVMLRGFSEEDIKNMRSCINRMWENIDNYLKEEMEDV